MRKRPDIDLEVTAKGLIEGWEGAAKKHHQMMEMGREMWAVALLLGFLCKGARVAAEHVASTGNGHSGASIGKGGL